MMMTLRAKSETVPNPDAVVCGICLEDLAAQSMHILSKCKCSFCKECLTKYFQFMIDNGHLRIYCPSYKCMHNNEINVDEIVPFISMSHYIKYQVMLNNKLQNNLLSPDQSKIRCPFCDQIFDVKVEQTEQKLEESSNSSNSCSTQEDKCSVKCPNCLESFCATCHLKLTNRQSAHHCTGNDLNEDVLNEFDIKRCPSCRYLIQREGGCAQISCRNCNHIFCWHCLKSLENDFLLFHYDSGPCKNRLGHSRISIFFNRAQTISICLGISILMILASPVILMTLPCLLTSKCRQCCRHKRNQHHHRHHHDHNNNNNRQT